MRIKKLAWMILGTLLSVCASADTKIVDGITWTYTVKNGQASVGGGTEATPAVPRTTTGAIVIPSTLDSYPVTAVSVYAFDNCYALTSIMIPEGVTSIGDYAFYGCSALTSVSIPASVTTIGNVLFSQCAKLSEIEVDAENHSYAAKDGILYDKSMTALLQCLQTRKTVTIPGSVTSVGDKAFYGSSALTSLTIPEGVTNIGVMAFYGCDKLMSVMYVGDAPVTVGTSIYGSTPSSLTTYVRSGTKGWDGNPQSTTIPQSWPVGDTYARPIVAVPARSTVTFDLGGHATRIGGGELTQTVAAFDAAVEPEIAANTGWAFMGWSDPFDCVISNLTVTALYESTVPTNGVYKEVVDGIEWTYTIKDGKALAGDGVSSEMFGDGGAIPQGTTASDITIPATLGGCPVIGITDYAFQGFRTLQSVTIPDGVADIGSYAFARCGLKSISIPSSVTNLDQYAFQNCPLTEVELSEGLTSIRYCTFSGCGSLTAVTIPASVVIIESQAFEKCYSLRSVTFEGDAPKRIYTGIYTGAPTNLVTYVNYGSTGWIAEGETGLPESWPVGDTDARAIQYPNGVYTQMVDGIEWTYVISNGEASVGGGIGTSAVAWSTEGAIVVPQTLGGCPVVEIGNGAFGLCYSLTSVTVPDGVTSIGMYAFYNCSELQSVVIPASVTNIAAGAFVYCGSLAEISLDPDNPAYRLVDGILYDKGMMTIRLCPPVKEGTVAIAEGVTSIGPYAFSGGCVQSVIVPASVTEIGVGAFASCTNLNKVAFKGDAPTVSDEWETNEGIYNGSDKVTNYVFTGTSGWDVKDPLLIWPAVGPWRPVVKLSPTDTFTVTFDLGGHATRTGGGELEQTVAAFDAAVEPEIKANAGYTFTGWSNAFDCVISNLTVTALYDYATPTNGTYTEVVDGLEWTFVISNGVASVGGGIEGMTAVPTDTAGEIAIPATLGGCPVTGIGSNAFYRCNSLTLVTIHDGLTSIGGHAFYECSMLGSITIPSSVTDWGIYAFRNSGLTNVVFSEGLTSIGERAFYDCSKLGSVTIPSSVTNWGRSAFVGSGLTNVVFSQGLTSIGGCAFSHCSKLGEVTIHSSVTDWGDGAFEGSGLTNVVLSEGLTSIGENAFYYCSKLEEVIIPSSITDWGSGAFRSSGLTNVVLSEGLTSIGENAFYYCIKLGEVTIPSSITDWGSEAFVGSGLTNVVLSQGLTSIGSFAFENCSKLGEVTIPSSITDWGSGAFRSSGLTNVVLSQGLTSIGSYAFYKCSKLGEVTIPSSVTDLGGCAFAYSALTNVVLSEGLTSIGYYAFDTCTNLTAVTLPESVAVIDFSAFRTCTSLEEVTIHKGVSSIGHEAFYNCDNLATVYCDAGDSARVSNLLANSGFDVSKLTFIAPLTAENIEKVYDGIPTNFVVTVTDVQEGVTTHVAYSLDGVTYASESPAFTNVLRDADGNVLTQKVWYAATADNGTLNVTNFATVAILPRTVEVEVTGCTNTVAFTGEPQSVEGYGVAFEDELYSADWIDFGGTNRVEATAVGKYDMGLKLEDFANTNANFAVTFGVTDGWLEITLPTDGTYTEVVDGLEWTYVISNGEASVGGGIDGMTAVPKDTTGEIAIPVTLGGCPVTGIGLCAFNYCDSLTSVTIPEGVTSIGDGAFICCGSLTSVTIPSSVTSIGDYAFNYCDSLTSATIPEGVTNIGVSAFYACQSLSAMTIPEGVTRIGNETFRGCVRMASVTIPEGVTSIGDWAFAACSFESVAIPSSVMSIGDNAFYGCFILSSVELPQNLESLGDYAFELCALEEEITIPAKVSHVGAGAFGQCTNMKGILVNAGNAHYSSRDGILYDLAGTTLVEIPAGKSGDLAIPDDVTSIADGALYGCTSLSSVKIPAGVTNVGDSVFYWCTKLTEVRYAGDAPDMVGASIYGNTSTNLTTYVIDGTTGWDGNPGSTVLPEMWPVGDSFARPLVAVPAQSTVTFDLGGHATRTGGGELEQTVAAFDAAVEPEIAANAGYTFTGWSDPFDFIISNLTVTALYGYATPTNGTYTEVVDGLVWTYVISNGEASVGGGTSGMTAVPTDTAGEIAIPVTLGGCPVTGIGDYAFKGCYSLTLVTIHDGVSSIGKYAFETCSELGSVTIPSSVTNWGSCAFFYSGLTNVVFSEGLTSIGECAFGSCMSLESVTIPEGVISIGEGAFGGCMSLESVTIPEGVISIGGYAFSDCDALTSVTIPEGVTNIGVRTFFGCGSLKSVTIPGSVMSIGLEAFYNCSSLDSVTIPEGVVSIGERAFGRGHAPGIECEPIAITLPSTLTNNLSYCFDTAVSVSFSKEVTNIYDSMFNWCENLVTVMIPEGVTNIGEGAFAYSGLASVTIPEGVTNIGEVAFAYSGLTSVAIPGSVKSIAAGAFSDCTSLKELTISDGVESIGMGAFYDCTALESVTIPKSVLNMGIQVFSHCTSLVSVTIAGTATNYFGLVFEDCTALTSATFLEGATRVYDSCFIGCTSLVSVAIPESVKVIEHSAFEDCTSLEEVMIPESVTNIGDNAFKGCSKLGEVTIPSGVTDWDGAFESSGLTNVVLSQGLTSIGSYAFNQCSKLGSVTIPSSVTDWGVDAFYASGLTNVVLSEGLTSIGGDAFYNCSKLGEVTIPSSVTDWGFDAFYASGLTNVVFSEGLTSIGDGAFPSCTNLTAVTIPESVASIGGNAFYRCSALEEITIHKGVTSIGTSAFGSCDNLTTVYCDAGDSARVSNLLANSGFDVSKLTFIAPQITAENIEKVYDGVPTNFVVTVADVQEGVTTHVAYSLDGVTYAPESPAFTNVLRDAEGNVLTQKVWYVASADNGTLNVTNFATVAILPRPVEVAIAGHTNTVAFTGEPQSVEGYEVAFEDALYDANWIAFGGTNRVAATAVGKYDMGLKPEDFANTNANFAVTFGVTDGWLAITNGTILANAANATKVYDGEATNIAVTVTVPAEGAAVSFRTEEGEWTEAAEFAGLADAGTNKVWYLVEATGYTAVSNFAYVVIEPRTVEVAIAGHTNMVAFTGEPQSVEGYEVAFEDELYSADWIDFSGEASVEATAVGKYDMGLKPEDFANTNANFAVTFGVTDGWLAITNGTILANAANATKVYDGEATNIAVTVMVPAEGAAVSFRTEEGDWTAAAEFSGIADAGTNKVWYLVEATGYSAVSNFAYVVIEPRTVEVAIAGHTNMVAFTGEPQSVEGYEVAFEDELYSADWIDFSGEASVEATAVGKYDMGLKPEDFANTNANFAVTFGVTDGWLAITNGTILANAANATKVYDGEATNIAVSVTVPAEGAAVSFRTEEGEWTEAAEFAGLSDAGTNKVWYLVEATGYSAVSNFAYVVIEPRAVEVAIVGHTNTVAFTGEKQYVEGYEVAFENELYSADWIDFSGEASVEATAVGKYDMGLKAEDFANTNANFAVTFGVTDGWLAITNGTILANAANATKVYDGEATNIAVTVTVPAEGAAVSFRTEDGDWTAAAEFSGLADAGTNKVWYLVEATGYSAVSNFAYVVIEPRAVEVEVTGHTNMVAFTGEPQSVDGYEVAFEDDLYNADWIEFSGDASVEATAVGKYDMGLKPEDFANTNANFTVTFGMADGWLEITVKPNGTYTEVVDGLEWTYVISNGEASVGGGTSSQTAVPTSTAGVLVIPSSLGGCPVTAIGASAFYGCDSLKSVTIPDGVTSIGDEAFANCLSLTSVTIPRFVESIGDRAFVFCQSMDQIVVDAANPSYASDGGILYDKAMTTLIQCPGAKVSVTIPEIVTRIGGYAFTCGSLTLVTIPGSVTNIGQFAFEACHALMSVTISDGVKSLDDGVFSGCSALTSVTIPASVTSFGRSVFAGCVSLTEVIYCGNAPACAGWTYIVADNVTSYVFADTKGWDGNPESTAIPEMWPVGDEYARPMVAVPRSCTVTFDLGGHAVRTGGGELTQTVAAFGAAVAPTVSPNVGYTFTGWSNSFDRVIGDTTVYAQYENVTPTDGTYSETVEGVTWNFAVKDGQIALGGGYNKKTAVPTSTSGTVKVPTALAGIPVTSLGRSAFDGCSGVTEVVLPDGLLEVGSTAFRGCTSLRTVRFPTSLLRISTSAFSGCKGLSELTLPENLTAIGNYSFSFCTSLTSLSIPPSVTSLGASAFEGCKDLASLRFEGDVPQGLARSGLLDSARSVRYPSVYAAAYAAIVPAEIFAGYTDTKMVMLKSAANNREVTVGDTWVSVDLSKRFGKGKVAEFKAKFGGDLAGALARPTGKIAADGRAMTVLDDYIAGTDPTDVNSTFKASIGVGEDGKPVVSWSPDLNENGAKAVRTYRVLGAKALGEPWVEVPEGTPNDCTVFKVEVALPEPSGAAMK